MKLKMSAARIPDLMTGNVTRTKLVTGPAPSTCAASSIETLTVCRFAITTRIGQTSFNRSANKRMNSAGMCCTITIGGVSMGNCVSSASSAWGPPVDAPIAISPLTGRLILRCAAPAVA